MAVAEAPTKRFCAKRFQRLYYDSPAGKRVIRVRFARAAVMIQTPPRGQPIRLYGQLRRRIARGTPWPVIHCNLLLFNRGKAAMLHFQEP